MLYEVITNGYAPNSVDIGKEELLGAFKAFLTHAESTIRANRREDGLYHAYNTLAVRGDGSMDVEYLNEMLEGQVAVLSSGQLNSGEALDLLNAMKKSDLWREDHVITSYSIHYTKLYDMLRTSFPARASS